MTRFIMSEFLSSKFVKFSIPSKINLDVIFIFF